MMAKYSINVDTSPLFFYCEKMPVELSTYKYVKSVPYYISAQNV